MSQPLPFSSVPSRQALVSKKKHFASCSALFARSFFLGLLLVLQREVVTLPLCTIQETWPSGSRCRIRAIPEFAGRL